MFVTLKKRGELRGCIGSLIGREPLFRGVETNAVHAAMDDPRFPPLRENELAGVEIEILVMTPLRPLQDYRSIRLEQTAYWSSAMASPRLFFCRRWPKRRAGTLDQFLASLCRKAGLDGDAYRRSPTMQFHVFQAQVFSEKGMKK